MRKILANILLPILAANHVHASKIGNHGTVLEGRQISLDITNETQSRFNTTTGVVNGLRFEIDNEKVTAQDNSIEPPQHPAAFTMLWDYLDGRIRGELGCNENKEYCTLAAAGGPQVCILGHGDYPSDRRVEFINTARALFDRDVRSVGSDSDSGVTEAGPSWVAVQFLPQNSTLQSIQVSLRNRKKGDETNAFDIEYVYAGGASSISRAGTLVWTVVGLFCWIW